MNKIRNLLLGLLLIFVAPLMVACNQDTPPLNWDDRIYVSYIELDNESKTIPLRVNTTYKLKYNVMPQEANNKTVKFTTSNPSVATVDMEGNVTAVGSGSCNITIISQDNASALSAVAVVNVVNEREQLATPTGINYDGTRLTWNPVKAVNSATFAPKYSLSITRNGGDALNLETSATTYTDLPNGSYEIYLRALGDDDEVLYQNSELASYRFVKLGSPTNLKVTALGDVTTNEARTYEMSFVMAENTTGISDYEYRITPVNGSVLSPTQQEIWANAIASATVDNGTIKFSVPSDIAEEPVYVVFKTKTDVQNHIFGSNYENNNVIQIGRLSKPGTLHVYTFNAGSGIINQLNWGSIPNADQYKIKVVYKDAEDNLIANVVEVINAWGVNSFDLSNLSNVPAVYDSYDVYVYALGTSETNVIYMDSGSSDCAIKQLSTVQGEINISANNTAMEYTITWNKVKNAYKYRVYISNNSDDIITSDDKVFYDVDAQSDASLKLKFDQASNGRSIWNVGNNYIKIVVKAEQDTDYEDSAVRKAEQTLIKLATPQMRVSKGVLVWDKVENAGYYKIVFGSNYYDVTQDETKLSYSYEPTVADFENSATCSAYIYANNDDSDYIIKSQNGDTLPLIRYGTIGQEYLSVTDGKLSWKTMDTTGTSIATDTVEVKVLRTSDEQELKRITAGNGSLDLSSALADVDGDGFYSFSLRPINTNSSGTYYINGSWSDTIKTYQMQAPNNLRVVEGVLTWDPYVDDNVGRYNTAIRYVLKLGDAELTDVELSINTTSTVLQNLTSNRNYNISIQTRVLSNISGGSNMVVGSSDTYLINSEYSAEKRIKLVAKPIGLDIRDYTLRWSASSTTINRYTVSLYKKGDSEPLAVEENVSPDDRYNPSFDFSVNEFSSAMVLAGNYQFVVQAWGDDDSSLTSYVSDSIEICKLASPTITVNGGIISWTPTTASLDGISEPINDYYLIIRNNDTGATKEMRLNTNSTSLAEIAAEGEALWCAGYDGSFTNSLSITIQALNNGKSRIYNSDRVTYEKNVDDGEAVVTVYKLPKISIDSFNIKSDRIEWAIGSKFNAQQCFYNVAIYQKSNVSADQLVVQARVQADADGAGYYNISPNWSGAIYYIVVQQIGYQSTTITQIPGEEGEDIDVSLINRWITSEYSDAVYFDRFAEPAGVYLTADADGYPEVAWNVVNENENSIYKVTVLKLNGNGDAATEDANRLIYYVNYDANNHGRYRLNLYTNTDATGKSLRDLDEGAYYGEYKIYINAVRKGEDTGEPITHITGPDGISYLLMNSRTSKIQSMIIYQAPNIDVSGDSVKIINPNTSSKGVQLEFTELSETTGSGGEAILTPTANSFVVMLGSTEEYYEVDESILTPGKYYQVATLALGNSGNLVSSPKVVTSMVVRKLDKLTPNTVSAVFSQGLLSNATEFDGWYVDQGKVAWNNVEGAGSYRIYMTAQNVTKMAVERTANSASYSEALSDMSFKNNYGAFSLQFEVVGSKMANAATLNGESVTTGYLSSDLSSGVWVNKLYAPNADFDEKSLSYQIRNVAGTTRERTTLRTGAYSRIDDNGEFDFGLRDDGGLWIDGGSSASATGATAYAVYIQSADQNTYINYDLSETDPTKCRFYASDLWNSMSNAGEYNILLYSVGNTWYGASDSATNEIYLTSDAGTSFKIIYTGVVEDLSIENGQIVWATDVKNTINKYDLRYKIGSTESTVALTQKSFAFEDDYDAIKGEIIDEIYVRFAGNPTRRGAIEGYVNTAWNVTPLTRITKLPNIAKTEVGGRESDLFINYLGQLAWTMGDELSTLPIADSLKFNITRTVRLGQEVVQPSTPATINLKDQVYDVPRVATETGDDDSDLTYIYDIVAYVQGTMTRILASQQRASDPNAEVLYINGDDYAFSAGKLNTPKDGTFVLDAVNGGVRIKWDLTGCSISIADDATPDNRVDADQIMLTYTMNNDDTVITKFVDADEYKDLENSANNKVVGGMPLWQLGTFRDLRMVVLNSKGLAFGSSVVYLDTPNVEFNCFESGTGTRDDPFIITTVEQFTNSFWLPELYFRLANDLVLPELTTLKETYIDATTNVPYPASFYDDNAGVAFKYRDLSFEGGFDGNGHMIKNLQIIDSASMFIWSTLYGADLEPLMIDDQEFVDTVYQNTAGIITNLTIEVNTIDISSIQGIYNGIIVGNNYGLIYNCHIRGDDNKTNASGNRVSVVEGGFWEANDVNNTYYFGAIAGMVSCQKIVVDVLGDGDNARYLYNKSYVGRIEKCTNMLDLTVENINKNIQVFVGGIVGLNTSGYVVDCVNGMRNADAQLNTGMIRGYFSAGVVGSVLSVPFDEPATNEQKYTSVMYYSYVNGCKNYATVSSKRIEDQDNSASISGGIVSMTNIGYITNCINYGIVTTDGIAAGLGGILGFASSGAYVINNINAGYITYNEYTDLTYETKTQVVAGAIIGLMQYGVIYNAAFNSACINMFYEDQIVSSNSEPIGQQESGYAENLRSFADLHGVTQTEIESEANINAIEIAVDTTYIVASYKRGDGLIPRFVYDSTNSEWTINWVTAQPSSVDPTLVSYD